MKTNIQRDLLFIVAGVIVWSLIDSVAPKIAGLIMIAMVLGILAIIAPQLRTGVAT